MSEQVGGIYYDVRLETGQLIRDQRQVERSLKATSDAGDKLAANFNAIALAAKLLAVALATVKAAERADEMRLLAARVEVAAGSVEKGAEAMNRLVQISRTTQTAVEGNVDVFNRLNQSLIQMGGTQNDTLNLVDLLAKAIRVSGASAVEAKNAMLQFGQALGSGKLQGDELRSLLENAPYLMRQLADGIGKPVGELKKLGEQGKLTADVVVAALTKSAERINADFAKFPQTVSGAFQLVQDAAARLNQKMDDASGKSAALAGAAQGLSQVLDTLAGEFLSANSEADKLARNKAIKGWADETKVVLSYVVDAADLVWQTLSVLGRNVSFVFKGIGSEIGGIAAQMKMVQDAASKGRSITDPFGSKAAWEAFNSPEYQSITDNLRKDAEERRKVLDEADAKTLSGRKLAGQRMRAEWAQQAKEDRGFTPAGEAPSKLKAPKDDDEARKLAAKSAAAKAYYEGLVAENAQALAKIDAQERKELEENKRRAAEDKGNQEVYAAARLEIQKKFARERAKLEEQTTQQVADLNIAITTDEAAKIEMVQQEALRRADAAVKLGTMTYAEGERAKTLATFNADKDRAAIEERNARARYDAALVLTQSQEGRIQLTRDESVRQAEAAYKRGAMTFEEAEAKKTEAAVNAAAQLRQLQADRANTQIATLQLRASTTNTLEDQIATIQAEAAAKLAANQQAWAMDLEASQLYADQRVAIEEDMAKRIRDVKLQSDQASVASAASTADSLYKIMETSGKEQSALGRALFAASKALAVAEIIVNTEVQASKAGAALGLAGIPLATMIRAQGYASAAVVAAQAVTGARQYGGAVNAGNLYRVNEKGPEMFVGNNGRQYMMPTAGGQVVPADKVGGGITVNVTNAPAGTNPQVTVNDRTVWIDLAVKAAEARVAEGISANTGPVYGALRSSTNVRAGGLS